MRIRLFAVAVSGVVLGACGGGVMTLSEKSGGALPSSIPPPTVVAIAGATTPPSSELPGQSRSMLVPVGAQPVADTPVEFLPDHADHKPIIQTPATVQLVTRPAPVALRHLYVSTQGNDGASGLQGAPVKTLRKAVSLARAGDVIHVQAGTYAETVQLNGAAGTAAAKITLLGEGSPTLVPPAGTSGFAMIEVNRPYWVISGIRIDVRNQPKYAVAFFGKTTGSTLENSELSRGAFGGGVTTYDGASDVLIENNHIHHFSRGQLDSHGVVVQPTSKNITIRNNDIHDVSGDSVQCLGPEGFSSLAPAKGVLIEANHFYRNRENAIDIKTCTDVTIRANRMHGFLQSTTVGGAIVVVHMSASHVTLEDNTLYDGGKGIAIGGNRSGPMPDHVLIRRNKIHRMKVTNGFDGVGIRMENSQGAAIVNNTVSDVQGPAIIVGHGTGGPTADLTMMNNVIDAKAGVNLGAQAPGLSMRNNLYRSNVTFVRNYVTLDLSHWRALGNDESSFVVDGAVVSADERMAPGSIAVDSGLSESETSFCGVGPDLGAFEADCT